MFLIRTLEHPNERVDAEHRHEKSQTWMCSAVLLRRAPVAKQNKRDASVVDAPLSCLVPGCVRDSLLKPDIHR